MIVNVYIDNKGNLIDVLADESTSHRLGDIINLRNKSTQLVISYIQKKEQFDYGIITYVNRVVKSDSINTDNTAFTLEGITNEI